MASAQSQPKRDGQGSVRVGPERVRESVIDAAQRLFSERGIHAVSVREIAREVGVSHTLVHLYFGGKEEIVAQVLSRYDGRFHHEPEEASTVIVDRVFEGLATDGQLCRVLASALVEGVNLPEPASTTQELADYDERVLRCLASASAIGFAVAGEWLKTTAGLDHLSHEELVDELVRLLCKASAEASR